MSVVASGSRVSTDPNASLVLAVEEIFSGALAMGAVQATQFMRGQIPIATSQNVQLFGTTALPAGGTMQTVDGRHVVQIVSGAGAAVRGNNGATSVAMPLSQLFTGAASLNGILLNRPPREYVFTVPVRITVAGTARVEIGVGPNGGLLPTAGTPSMVVWSSDPAVNAGRWLPRSRQVDAGAITNGADSGVAPSGWHLLGFRYREGTNPTIGWLLDTTPRNVLTGDAQMPVFLVGSTNRPGYFPSYGVNSPAGTTVQFGEARFEVRNLSV